MFIRRSASFRLSSLFRADMPRKIATSTAVAPAKARRARTRERWRSFMGFIIRRDSIIPARPR